MRLKEFLDLSEGKITVYSENSSNYVFNTSTQSYEKYKHFIETSTIKIIRPMGNFNVDVITNESYVEE